ncbi:hypothetical protein LNL84_15240 [Vibrio sp. ZSDZ34]|uniref:Uncharacterized protein n=1 Tax=Vibrio gelatinilyticus TaxID=2893468 RepID=A0A9X2AWQ3_9VIBR|nr:hypothetical protein [Vibrio gelatinilyticus]MCJ2378174.1 hypothetical protein [Vibrio gelatinilyticus]
MNYNTQQLYYNYKLRLKKVLTDAGARSDEIALVIENTTNGLLEAHKRLVLKYTEHDRLTLLLSAEALVYNITTRLRGSPSKRLQDLDTLALILKMEALRIDPDVFGPEYPLKTYRLD